MKFKKVVILLGILGCSFFACAQPGNPATPNDNPVPIGGLELLLIGGAAFGAKKIISSRKKN